MSRPRGFAPWRPRSDTQLIVDAVNGILDEYQDQLPLSLRQVFYIAVTRSLVGKTERDYNRLCENLNRARRAMLVAMNSFRDNGFSQGDAPGWDDAEHLEYNVKLMVDRFTLDRQAGQDTRLIVWCEAQGMVPQLERVANQYSVPAYSSGGFDSLTAKHAVAKQISDHGEHVEILHLGDHDPTGVHMFGSLDEDVQVFAQHYGGVVEFTRLAVPPDQVEQFDLPTAPPKMSDNRSFEGLTTQCEALDPVTLANIVRAGIESRQDATVRQAVIDQEADTRDELLQRFQLTG